MRLLQYINENTIELGDVFSRIEKECAPFLKEWRSSYNSALPIRYSESLTGKPFGKARVRKRREPSDTPKNVHRMLDDLFLKYHGWKARSEGLFCLGRWLNSQEKSSSDHFYIFPIGDYKYLCSTDIKDLYVVLGNIAYDNFHRSNIRELSTNINKDPELYKNFYDILEGMVRYSYKDDDLAGALKSKAEVMFKCDNYWYISTIFKDKIIKFMKEGK